MQLCFIQLEYILYRNIFLNKDYLMFKIIKNKCLSLSLFHYIKRTG